MRSMCFGLTSNIDRGSHTFLCYGGGSLQGVRYRETLRSLGEYFGSLGGIESYVVTYPERPTWLHRAMYPSIILWVPSKFMPCFLIKPFWVPWVPTFNHPPPYKPSNDWGSVSCSSAAGRNLDNKVLVSLIVYESTIDYHNHHFCRF